MASFSEKQSLTSNNEGRLVVPKTDMRRLITASLCAYLGALSFGYVIGYSSPALPSMTDAGVLSPRQESWFGSAVTLGGLVGCPAAGWLVAQRGRRGALLAAAVPSLAGWLLIATGAGVWQLCAGRLLTGVASGIITVAAPMYIAETCPQALRGALGAGVQLAITVGIVAAYAAGAFLDWATLAALGAVLPVAAAAAAFRAPETPRHLLASGRRADALRALAALRGPVHDVESECSEIEANVAADASAADATLSLLQILSRPALRRPLVVGIALMTLQQLSGINVVMFYTVSIFRAAGWRDGAAAATTAVGAVQVVVTAIACMLMDRAGRRVLLVVSSVGMSIACFALAAHYAAGDALFAWLPLVALVTYIAAFSIGWGPVPMLIVSEIFPTNARPAAASAATLANWTFAFLVTSQYGALVAVMGRGGVFALFGTCLVFAAAFVLRAVPETKGRSLEEIERFFVGPRVIRGV